MNYDAIVLEIADLMNRGLASGAEYVGAERAGYMLLDAYGFTRTTVIMHFDRFIISGMSPEDKLVSFSGATAALDKQYDKLYRITQLAKKIEKETPDADVLRQWLDELENSYDKKTWYYPIVQIIAGLSFAIFFGCTKEDYAVALIALISMTLLQCLITKSEPPTMLYNAVLTAFAEFIILRAYIMGYCEHPIRITVGVVMLLISGLGFSNGIRAISKKRYELGRIMVLESILGAFGISIGICIALVKLNQSTNEGSYVVEGLAIQLVSIVIACMALGVLFGMNRKQLLIAGGGVAICWLVYSLTLQLFSSGIRPDFVATFFGALAVHVYAGTVARLSGELKSIFLTLGVLALVPGGNLFWAMYGLILKDKSLAYDNFVTVIVICMAIALAYSVSEIFESWSMKKHPPKDAWI